MRFRHLMSLSALLFSVHVLSGCSENLVSSSCTTDSQCGEFKCLRDQKLNNDNTCSDVPFPNGNCSPPCRTHADCTKYGSTLKCALAQTDISCNPTGICLDDYKITCNPGPCREAPAN